MSHQNNMKLVHWPLMGGLSHLVLGCLMAFITLYNSAQRTMCWWPWYHYTIAQPAVPNVTAHPSTASVPISVWV